ncbi:galacturonosyltransferase 14 [Actinidia rufa]|uniref:Hexosyltransferase n=1 Tax=Actinidia rufa TaxID=165716 RepID=A0A7J0H827_9ERIC|nr:galacturonosyltransferase 14 [Actinidia rufa]
MQLHFSPSMRSITISSSNGFIDLMKIKVAARHISYRVNKCSSFDCLGRRLGPRLLGRVDNSGKLVKEFYKILNQVSTEEIPENLKLPESFNQLVSEMKNKKYIAKDFVLILKGMMEKYERDIRESKYAFMVCPDPPVSPAIVEVKGVHQFEWLTRENVPVLEAVENHNVIRNYYHGNHIAGANLSETTPRTFASKLQARSPKYISLLNHLRIYLPELFQNLDKVVFLDDDVVVQSDLSPLWEVDLGGKVNGAVETCKGEDEWVMSKRFRNYFNFSHPLIAKNLNPDEPAWAYGMNIFDLCAWRRTNITDTYHAWLKENLKSNLTMWRLGTLPPALIAFKGHVQAIDPSWHMLGLGYQNKTNIESVKRAAVIHYNGQCKPWLQIGFEHLRPFWTKYVNYSNDFIRNCHILE